MPSSSDQAGKRIFTKGLLTGFFVGFVLSNIIFLHRISTQTCPCVADDAPSFSEAATAAAVVSATDEKNDNYSSVLPKHNQFKRLSCQNLFEGVRDGSVKDPNNGKLHKKFTVTNPPFWISLHNKETDFVRWDIMDNGFYYERFVTQHTKEILDQEPSTSLMIDVGMNIGWFSLWTKALGHKIIGFEPNNINQLRFCESLRLNNWTDVVDDVKVYPYGVGDEDTFLPLSVIDENNPGAWSFVRKRDDNTHPTTYIKIVTLDDIAEDEGWFAKQTRIALLKIDVEGFDAHVILGGSRLLKSGLVTNIFLEYSCKQSEEEQQKMKNAIVELAREKYRLKNIGSWDGNGIEGSLEYVVDKAKDEYELESRLFAFCKGPASRLTDQLNLWWVKV